MSDCVFCNIVSNKVPHHKIYEDEHIMAILDHRPVRSGHAMIIPKKHIDYFMNLPDELASHIVKTGNIIAKKMMQVLEPKPLTIGHVVHGYIPHTHYHLIPQHDWNDITSNQYARVENNKLVFDAEMLPIANNSSQEKIAKILRVG